MKNILKKIGRIILNTLQVIIVLYVILITSCILCRNKFGFTQFGEYTFNPIKEETAEYIDGAKNGDLVIIKNAGQIKVGDIAYFYDIINEKYIIRSAPVTDVKKSETISLYTIGNENRIVNSNRMIGKYTTIKHNWGLIMNILVSRIGFLFLVLLPIMIIFIYQIYGFIVMLKYDDDFKDTSKKQTKKTQEEEVI